MLARWFNVRLKTAERALRAGRLDDALQAARSADLRADPRAARLLDELVRPLLARARLQRQAGRLNDALADLKALAELGRDGPEVQTLRDQVNRELGERALRATDLRAAVAQATENAQAGRLDEARAAAERIADTRQRAAVVHDVEARAARAAQLVVDAGAALERDDVLAAVRLWREADEHYGRTSETEHFAGRAAPLLERAVRGWLTAGRLERVLAAAAACAALERQAPAIAECARLTELCGRAAGQLAGGDFAALRQTLLRLSGAAGEIPWLREAVDALDRVQEARDALLRSPLGIFATVVPARGHTPPGPARRAAPPELDARQPAGDLTDAVALRSPLLLLVDGGGSCLLLDLECVRLGRGGRAATVDVPLGGDVLSHHADIVRRGEDYFLQAFGPVEVNHRPAEHVLLHDGDRVVLGAGAKFVFSKPSAKSESAVLRLSHRSRLPQDVSEVILFRDTCLLGPTASCHVRTREGNVQLVLFGREGRLFARLMSGPQWQVAPARPVAAGQTLDFGDVRLTVKPYEVYRWESPT